jgi:hypothetical protein
MEWHLLHAFVGMRGSWVRVPSQTNVITPFSSGRSFVRKETNYIRRNICRKSPATAQYILPVCISLCRYRSLIFKHMWVVFRWSQYLDYLSSNNWSVGKDFYESGRGLLEVIFRHYLEGLYLIQGSSYLGRRSNEARPEERFRHVSSLGCMAYLQLSLCLVLFNVYVSSICI